MIAPKLGISLVVAWAFANSTVFAQYESQESIVTPVQQIDDSQPAPSTGGVQLTPVTDFERNGMFAPPANGNAQAENTFLQSQLPRQQTDSLGSKLYRSNDDFSQGLVIEGKDAAMKLGGYVKLDLLYDFNPIDNTDAFDVNSIPVGAPPRTNSRMHVRQTRFNFDSRWQTDAGVVQTFVEGDFFSEGNRYRLRHAYGKLNKFQGGQTWTTFSNIDASPATLDFEGSVSAISVRRAQVRWTYPICSDELKFALALEDSETVIELPPDGTIMGETRTVSPDFVARLRWTGDNGNIQVAGIARRLGFQPTGEPVISDNAWGMNFSQVANISRNDKVYWQINYGDGIASLLGSLPDITPTGPESAALLGYFGWMLGATHDWNDKLSSNFTFAESHFQNTSGQLPTDINNLTYVAANLIWSPLDHVDVGIEYLYGKREDINGASGLANRIQFAIFYYLP